MYVKRNSEVRWCNHCYTGEAISITYSECVFLALRIQHTRTTAILYYHLCSVWLCYIFAHYHINDKIFEEKKKILNVKCQF